MPARHRWVYIGAIRGKADSSLMKETLYACQSHLQRRRPNPNLKEGTKTLAANKLIGKIQLRSDMDEEEMFSEICSVFNWPMDEDDTFPFTILQSSGGDSRILMVPELSHSYH